MADSPAINAGNTVSYTHATSATTDVAGNSRVFGSRIDMGAYEFVLSSYTVYLPLITATQK